MEIRAGGGPTNTVARHTILPTEGPGHILDEATPGVITTKTAIERLRPIEAFLHTASWCVNKPDGKESVVAYVLEAKTAGYAQRPDVEAGRRGLRTVPGKATGEERFAALTFLREADHRLVRQGIGTGELNPLLLARWVEEGGNSHYEDATHGVINESARNG